VEMHGGTVDVQSAGLGQGAACRITLPAPPPDELSCEAPPAHATGQQIAAADSGPKLSGLRALVVDDEADARELVAAFLSMKEAEVRTAGSIVEAMRIMTAWRPEILICDIALPGGSGYELIKRMRDGGCKAPAIAITARVDVEDCARSIDAGFQLHIPKPIEPRDLLVSVAKLTERSR